MNIIITFSLNETIELYRLNLIKLYFNLTKLIHFIIDTCPKIAIIHNILH